MKKMVMIFLGIVTFWKHYSMQNLAYNLAWWLKKSWNIVKNGCDFGSVTACFGLE